MNTQIKPIAIATIALLSTALTGCCLGGDKCKPPKDSQPDAKYTHLEGTIKRESKRDLFIHKLGEEIGYSGSIDFSETSNKQGFSYTKLIHNGKLSEFLNNNSQIEIATNNYQSPITYIGDKGKNGDIIDITLIPTTSVSKYKNTFYTKGYANISFTQDRIHIDVPGICNGTKICSSVFGLNINDIKTPIYNGMPIPVPEEARPLLNYKGQPIDYVNGFMSNNLFDITYNKFTEEFKTPENLLLQALHIRAKTEIKNVILWDRENDLVFRFPVYNTVDNIYIPELPTDFILPRGNYIINVEDVLNRTIEGNSSSGDIFQVESMLLLDPNKQNTYLYSRQDN